MLEVARGETFGMFALLANLAELVTASASTDGPQTRRSMQRQKDEKDASLF